MNPETVTGRSKENLSSGSTLVGRVRGSGGYRTCTPPQSFLFYSFLRLPHAPSVPASRLPSPLSRRGACHEARSTAAPPGPLVHRTYGDSSRPARTDSGFRRLQSRLHVRGEWSGRFLCVTQGPFGYSLSYHTSPTSYSAPLERFMSSSTAWVGASGSSYGSLGDSFSFTLGR